MTAWTPDSHGIERVLFIGSKASGLACLKELYRLRPEALASVLTCNDADGHGAKGQFASFTTEVQVPLHVADSREASNDVIRTVHPDLCVVHNWYWLITADVLAAIPHGAVGFHNSLLPKYRGSAPLVWQMLNGETTAGVTLSSLCSEMDAGDVWAQAATPIRRSDSIADVLNRISGLTLDILVQHYTGILDGTSQPAEQNHIDATYCAPRCPDDGEIDWTQPADVVYDFIRAQSYPYPGAFTWYDGKKLIVWTARANGIVYHGAPGQVARPHEGLVYVVCGDHQALTLETVEYDKRIVHANQIVRSGRSRLGRKQRT